VSRGAGLRDFKHSLGTAGVWLVQFLVQFGRRKCSIGLEWCEKISAKSPFCAENTIRKGLGEETMDHLLTVDRLLPLWGFAFRGSGCWFTLPH
jgi:hypothetical protein